jgi:hypothetical protein
MHSSILGCGAPDSNLISLWFIVDDEGKPARLGFKIGLMKAPADRSTGILTVDCPHCQEKNEFPEWSNVDVFICEFCGEPVEVEDSFL